MACALRLIEGKRLSFKDMISETASPTVAHEVFTRLATDKAFPIGFLFDWSNV